MIGYLLSSGTFLEPKIQYKYKIISFSFIKRFANLKNEIILFFKVISNNFFHYFEKLPFSHPFLVVIGMKHFFFFFLIRSFLFILSLYSIYFLSINYSDDNKAQNSIRDFSFQDCFLSILFHIITSSY